MKKSNDIAIQFKKELSDLLKKYEAEIEINDRSSYSGCNPTMEVYIQSQWDKDNNCIAESVEIDLGRWYGF